MFLPSGFPFILSGTLTIHRIAGERRGPSLFLTPLPPGHKCWDIHLQLSIGDLYFGLLPTTLCNLLVSYSMRFTHLRQLEFDWTSNSILIADLILHVTIFFTEKLQSWSCIKYYHSVTNIRTNQARHPKSHSSPFIQLTLFENLLLPFTVLINGHSKWLLI